MSVVVWSNNNNVLFKIPHRSFNKLHFPTLVAHIFPVCGFTQLICYYSNTPLYLFNTIFLSKTFLCLSNLFVIDAISRKPLVFILIKMLRSKTASASSRGTAKNFVKESSAYKVNKQPDKKTVPGTYTLHP